MNPSAAALADRCQRYWLFHCDEFPYVALIASQPVDHGELLREAPDQHH